MASLFGHGVVGATLGYLPEPKASRRLIVLSALSAILPDIDVIGYFWGVAYQSPWGHRGFTHSLLFAVLWGGLLGLTCFRKGRFTATLTLIVATLSHGVFDAMTTGGHGVGFFIPFQNERFFFPWRPIAVSPIGLRGFAGARALRS